MHPDESIHVDGTVTEALPQGLFRVVLSNGHVLLGHLAKTLKAAALEVPTGSVVELELSPCDLSRGRILGVKPRT